MNQWLESIVARTTGEYEKAIHLCESSLTLLTNCFGSEHLVLVSVRDTLADIYQQVGMYERALPLFQENLQTLERTIGTENVALTSTLNYLGSLHYRLGNYSDAERFCRRSLSICEKNLGVDSARYAGAVNNLAVVLEATGNDEDVSALFERAVLALDKSVGTNSPALATVLLNCGMYLRSLGQTNPAKRVIEEAIVIRDKAFGTNHPAMAEAVEAYAQLQCDLGDFNYAQHLAMQALSIKTNFYGRDHPAMADTVSTTARIYAGMQDEYKAAEFYATSAEIRARAFGSDHPTVAKELEAAGLALCRAGEFEEAVRPLLKALRSQRDYMAGQVARTTIKEGSRLADQMYYRTELFHSLCALSFSNAAASVAAKAAEQLASCKALLEEVQATQASLESDARTSTHELHNKLEAIQIQLARLPENNLDPTQRDARRRQLQSTKTQIEEALAEWNGLVAQTIHERNLTLTDIARSLPPQSVLLDLIQYQRYDFAAKTNQWKEARYAAYLTFPLARGSTNVVVERVDLGEAAPINETNELVSKRMTAGVGYAGKDILAALQRLSDLVYAPLARHLTNVSHLIVCPDGQLSRLPFEMLPVGNKFLLEEKTISYVTSGREIVRIARPKSKTKSSKSLVMGNPDFDFDLAGRRRREEALTKSSSVGDPKSEIEVSLLTSSPTRSLSRSYRGLKFDPLPGSGVEATKVANLLGEDAVLKLGAGAREAELKAVISPRVLHLATHAFFLSDQDFRRTNSSSADLLAGLDARQRVPTSQNEWENPLVRCGIALAGANHARQITNAVAEDGLLTGLKASLLNLQGTELVILSACQTGSGEVKIGEGVMSLRRAFRIAGAESVLASHWQVSDKATSQLMTEFMQRWRAGEPRAKAWRDAQLALLRSKGAKEDFSNPYFWAAFTLTGQWN